MLVAEDPGAMSATDMDVAYDDAQKELNRKILEKVASDPDFRGHLLEDPEGALEKAGLGDEYRAIESSEQPDDVEGHWMWRTKRFWRYGILWHWR